MTLSDIGLGFIVGVIIAFILLYQKLKKEEQNRITLAKQLSGTYVEKLVPFMKECKYDPKDMIFLGKPIDYIIFDRNSNDEVNKVVFLEVKTGNSQLSVREKSLFLAVKDKRVEWDSLRL